jgi:hypothetical protein
MQEKSVIPIGRIENIILFIRSQKVILDKDLAQLYGVTTGNLNKAVKRNQDRFPQDFMFQLTQEEYKSLRFQFGILEKGQHSKYLPNVFTEQGVAMLSGVLNSPRAVQVNIEIMRAFVRLRQILLSHTELARKIEQMEKKYDKQFRVVFEAIRQLMAPPAKPKRKIGFNLKERQARYGRKAVRKNSRD